MPRAKASKHKHSSLSICIMESSVVVENMAGIHSAKKALRNELKNVIAKISNEEKKRQSQRVYEKLRSLPQYKESKRISLYLSTADEIDTVHFLKDIFESNREAFVPFYEGKIMKMVKLHSMEDYEKLPLTKWNIKQPAQKDVRDNALETGGLDLIILPGMGFSASGNRLGHGMGYYDKFLKECWACNANKKPHCIGVAFNEQIRDDIPMTEEDVPVDLVIAEKLC